MSKSKPESNKIPIIPKYQHEFVPTELIRLLPRPTKKLTVGFFSITGCAGCQLSVLFNERNILDLLNLIDIKAFPFIMKKTKQKKFDIIFMEGLVATHSDKKTLLDLRSRTKLLVALGACAHSGCVPAYRAYTLKKNYLHLIFRKKQSIKDINPTPLSSHVSVDFVIPGCPPDKKEIISFIRKVSSGIFPHSYTNPVCVECRRQNVHCLLEEGKMCLGPIIAGGCHAVCPSGGLECWGCRGLIPDAEVESHTKLLIKLGFSKKEINRRLDTFTGLIRTNQYHGHPLRGARH